MSVLIKGISNVNSEGVTLELTQKAMLHTGISTDVWRVSWDKIGEALFKDQYSNTVSVAGRNIERSKEV